MKTPEALTHEQAMELERRICARLPAKDFKDFTDYEWRLYWIADNVKKRSIQ